MTTQESDYNLLSVLLLGLLLGLMAGFVGGLAIAGAPSHTAPPSKPLVVESPGTGTASPSVQHLELFITCAGNCYVEGMRAIPNHKYTIRITEQ